MKRSGLWGFAKASFVFAVIRPLILPFLRPVMMLRQARAILGDMPLVQSDPANVDPVVDDAETMRQRRISRKWALLFMLLSMGVWGWWLEHILSAAWMIMRLPSLETILISGALGLQSLVQCYTNWRARGHQGSFTAFLADAQNLWPR
ncbi:hypothetical protein [Asaia krungthepensis]|uniref:hypothetical protein n=1 Tax=Asaia krungthepensis TaxID=220990 RepID=UPI002230700E|nr:hypothetical protein [Asaia krungthepensis]